MPRSALAATVLLVTVAVSNGQTVAPSRKLPGLQTTFAPWSAGLEHLAERLKAIGFPQLPWGDVSLKLHTHQHLDILIHGKPGIVPANIGISQNPKFLSPLHTHDPTGIIHVESPTMEKFTLGQFFDVWGVRLNSRCIGGHCARNKEKLRIFVNGKLVKGDPRKLALAPHQEIVIAFGNARQLPDPVPETYKFPPGL